MKTITQKLKIIIITAQLTCKIIAGYYIDNQS
jgi:hypothetical protein